MEAGPEGQAPQMTPEQEEMMRQMEEEMAKVRVQDLITQSVVSILNLSARRIGKEDERDLEQARIGIEAIRAMVDFLEPEAATEVRNALSQLQMMYAQQSGPAGAGDESPAAKATAPSQPDQPKTPPPGLWVPGQ